ncbi:MAG: hypothetical protein EBU70_05875 [Actinobacteria bacterium]|nr:hypothetical protein [Actinomycetota bacterium]
MGVRDRLRSLAPATSDLGVQRLTDRFEALGLVPLASAPARVRTTVCGEVVRITLKPRAGASSTELVIDDGTGQATVVFSGRPSVRGIGHGTGMVIDGVGFEERGRLVFLNPAYRLLPAHAE